jgi:hypothetical protein
MAITDGLLHGNQKGFIVESARLLPECATTLPCFGAIHFIERTTGLSLKKRIQARRSFYHAF